MLGFHFDTVALKEVEGIFGETFVEHRENLWGYVVDCYVEVRDERWIELLEILVAEVEELGGELHSGGWMC